MSDDEDYEYEYGSDENYDYGSEAEEQDETAIEIENAFYEADGTFHTLQVWSLLTTLTSRRVRADCKSDNHQQALELFEKCVRLETERGDEVKW